MEDSNEIVAHYSLTEQLLLDVHNENRIIDRYIYLL